MPTLAKTDPPWLVTPEKIAAVVERWAEQAHPSRIYVFGSVARGDTHRFSDVDWLVVMPGEVPDWKKESLRLGNMVLDINMAMDILVVSETEAEEKKNNRYGIVGPAQRTGKLVYEAPK